MTKIKATNKEMLETLHGLYAVQDLKGVKFAVAVSKNIEKLRNELKHIDEASKPSPEFEKLLQEADKIEKSEESEKLIKKLEKENKELIDKRKAQLEEVNDILEETVELDLVTMSEKNLPQDITAKQLSAIIKIVNN
tara:strand:+ start:451 stop:861 length:411 start_codon:yes stop_codon:yes gene_type:complete